MVCPIKIQDSFWKLLPFINTCFGPFNWWIHELNPYALWLMNTLYLSCQVTAYLLTYVGLCIPFGTPPSVLGLPLQLFPRQSPFLEFLLYAHSPGVFESSSASLALWVPRACLFIAVLFLLSVWPIQSHFFLNSCILFGAFPQVDVADFVWPEDPEDVS